MIKLHNNKIMSEEEAQDQRKCNYRQKDTFPLDGIYLDKEPVQFEREYHQCLIQ